MAKQEATNPNAESAAVLDAVLTLAVGQLLIDLVGCLVYGRHLLF